MKIKITKRDLELLGIQAEAWLVLMLVPAITTFFSTHSWMDTYHALTYSMRIIAMPAGVYFVNFCILIPLCYYRGRRWLFFPQCGVPVWYRMALFHGRPAVHHGHAA